MKSDLYLGIDQGTSSTKGVLVDGSGASIAEWSAAAPQVRYDDRCVEQDAEQILTSVVEVFAKAQRLAKERNANIRGAGLAVQRSGVLAWQSSDGAPLCPMMTWADTRTYPQIQAFGRGAEIISGKTGIPTIPNFAAGKIHLLQRRFLDPIVHVGTLDSFLLFRLSGGKVFVTEDTMASRTMLYALAERHWSDDLCRQFEVDKKRLPRINPSIAPHTSYDGIPIVATLGDQQAALLGRMNAARRPLLTLGTIASLTVDTGATPTMKPAVKTSVLYSRLLPNAAIRELQFLVEQTSPVTGTVLLEPLRRSWCANTEELQTLCDEAYRANPAGMATAYFVNKQNPTETWPRGIPNVMVCRPGAAIADRARAIVENVGNLIVRVIDEMAEKGLLGDVFPAHLDLAGGGSELDYLVQYVADVSGHTFHRFATREAGARGAACAAWMSVHGQGTVHGFNTEQPIKVFSCQNPERRKRYLMWQRMEQDVFKNSLPPHAEIEE
jgi:glycerol kinase